VLQASRLLRGRRPGEPEPRVLVAGLAAPSVLAELRALVDGYGEYTLAGGPWGRDFHAALEEVAGRERGGYDAVVVAQARHTFALQAMGPALELVTALLRPEPTSRAVFLWARAEPSDPQVRRVTLTMASQHGTNRAVRDAAAWARRVADGDRTVQVEPMAWHDALDSASQSQGLSPVRHRMWKDRAPGDHRATTFRLLASHDAAVGAKADDDDLIRA